MFDRDRRWDTADVIDSRLIHAVKKLPHIRAERFDVASLAFSVNRIECQTRFATSTRARDDRQFPERQIDVDPFQVILTRSPNLDMFFRDWRPAPFYPRNLRTHWKYSLPVKRFANFVVALLREANSSLSSSRTRYVFATLRFKTRHELFALLLQILWNYASKRIEKFLVLCEFLLPFPVIDSEKFGHGRVIDLETTKIKVMGTR